MPRSDRNRKAGSKASARKSNASASSSRRKQTSVRKSSTRKSAARTGTGRRSEQAKTRRGGSGQHLTLVGEEEKLNRLVEQLGNNRVAELMSVSRSQPSRWRRGEERLGPENRRKLIDLDYVFSRLLQLYPKEQAEIWLRSHNAHLGARPIDVLKIRGAVRVIEAIDAEAEGAFA